MPGTPRFCFALLLLVSLMSARAGELRVGAAAVVITPPVGIPMAGYYNTRLAEGTLDDLFARAMVLEQDGAKAALVVVDLVTISRPIVEEARKLIEKNSGIRGGAVMISATHSHTGPLLTGMSARNASYGGDLDIAKNYSAALPHKIAEAVKQASAKLAAAKVAVGVGREDSLPFNRRYFMKDGSVGWNPGKLNPNIVRPAGPIDPAVPIVYAESLDRKPIATYVNFAMHLDTTSGMKFSADLVYELTNVLTKLRGPDMVTLFTIGCAGDVNHVNFGIKDPQKGPEEAARIGTVLAGEVIKTYTKLAPVASTAPRFRSEIVKLPLPALAAGDVEKARALVTRIDSKTDPKFLEKVWAFKVLDVYARDGKPLECEVQVIALGDDLAWVSLPGEIFVELGLAIKERSPFKHTIIAELANGSIGYVPTRRGFAEGNYEPVSARCAEGSGEMLVEAALRLLKELKPN
jgi:neutral ceramidase